MELQIRCSLEGYLPIFNFKRQDCWLVCSLDTNLAITEKMLLKHWPVGKSVGIFFIYDSCGRVLPVVAGAASLAKCYWVCKKGNLIRQKWTLVQASVSVPALTSCPDFPG